MAGINRGDRIVEVESAFVANANEIVSAISSHEPSDRIGVVVEREGRRHELSVHCLDSGKGDQLRRQAAQAALERRWDDCMRVTHELDAVEGRSSSNAQFRLDCYEAKVARRGYRPSLGHARLLYEAKSRMMNEMAFSPDGLEEVRGDILAAVTWLENWRFGNLAHDLRDQLDSANSQPSARAPPDSSATVSYGTCFSVHPEGLLITAHHVVATADSISVRLSDGREHAARVEQAATANDLALLKIDRGTPSYLSLVSARSISSGQSVFTIGFPIRSLLGEEPKFSDGAISSLSGIHGEASLLQTTVPVQPGNSGGPLTNYRGQVVGIVTSTAAVERFFAETGSLPQNINWAVKADYARPLFDSPPPLSPTSSREAAIKRVRQALCSVEAKGE